MRVCVHSAGLGSICRDDVAFTRHSFPPVAPQQVQVREHETSKEVVVALVLHFMSLCSGVWFILRHCSDISSSRLVVVSSYLFGGGMKLVLLSGYHYHRPFSVAKAAYNAMLSLK